MSTSPEPNTRRPARTVLWRVVGAGLFLVVAVALLLPAIQPARESVGHSPCRRHLRSIGLALNDYHNQYHCFPPAYIADEAGRPMHSWRVLLLPYLEQQTLYDKYDFSQPWDSPQNLAVAKNVPWVYRCPGDPDAAETETSYVMVVGPGTISDGPTPCTISECKDGPGMTIAIVEMSASGIPWAEPRDLDFATMSLDINDPAGTGIRSRHGSTGNSVFVDGTGHVLSEDIPPELLRGLLTVAGGEDVEEFFTTDW